MSADLLHLIIVVAIAAAAVIRVTAWLEKGAADIEHAKRVCLDRPTSTEVEADRNWGAR